MMTGLGAGGGGGGRSSSVSGVSVSCALDGLLFVFVDNPVVLSRSGSGSVCALASAYVICF